MNLRDIGEQRPQRRLCWVIDELESVTATDGRAKSMGALDGGAHTSQEILLDVDTEPVYVRLLG